MSMKMLTILQFIQILAAYSVMTLLLPALLFYTRLRKKSFAERFFVYQVAGNFYMINLVLIMELLHISNVYTLWVFTLVPFTAAYIILHKKKPLRAAASALETLRRLASGQLGMRLFLHRLLVLAGQFFVKAAEHVVRRIRRNLLDVVLILGFSILLLYLFGTNAVTNYGYCASDVPVHNYWINAMSENRPFVAGVYPFGFHCVIYYLHETFGIATYVLLRLFWLVQTLMIHYALLAFIRLCCKSKYVCYIGAGIYAAVDIFGSNTYTRYYSSLPQEFGMLFILPAIYFLFAFLEQKKAELAQQKPEQKKEKKKGFSRWYLVCFAMSFSMTLAIHFYDTMIAGVFCVGIAAGYCFRLFRKQYFGRIMLAGILSIVIAVLPMGIAFAGGTPLQGSLGWGMNVITGGGSKEAEKQTQETENTENKQDTQATQTTEHAQTAGNQQAAEQTKTDPSGTEKHTDQTTETQKQTAEKADIKTLVMRAANAVWQAIQVYLIPGERTAVQLAVPVGILLLFVLSLLFFLQRQTDYAARFLSTAVYMGILSIVFGASRMGLPVLMDAIRTCIFYAYTIVIVWSFCIDGILYLLLGWSKKQRVINLASLLLLAAACIGTQQLGLVKKPRIISAFQTNEAVTCLTNILHDNKIKNWTICSANDELRMAQDYGYHYEVSTFLGLMESTGGYSTVTMDTHTVYFFIEKKPIDYAVKYENSGQYISEEGAAHALPAARGISMYQGENRWIEMSRLYYWAQKFRQMYPNEMEVYYETDNFVCYRVVQNDYRLYNFSIDYDYNMRDYEEEKE